MKRGIDILDISDTIGGVVGVAAFASLGFFGLMGYRSSVETDLTASSAALSTVTQESDTYTRSLPPACSDLIFQLMPHAKDWRETADRVAKSGLCGAGSDGIVTKIYTYHEQIESLETHVRDKTNELNNWGGQIIIGGIEAGFVATIIGKGVGFAAFCVADSVVEKAERKERDRVERLKRMRARQKWHNPNEANDPFEPKVSDTGKAPDES